MDPFTSEYFLATNFRVALLHPLIRAKLETQIKALRMAKSDRLQGYQTQLRQTLEKELTYKCQLDGKQLQSGNTLENNDAQSNLASGQHCLESYMSTPTEHQELELSLCHFMFLLQGLSQVSQRLSFLAPFKKDSCKLDSFISPPLC